MLPWSLLHASLHHESLAHTFLAHVLFAHGAPPDRAVTWGDWNADPAIALNLALVGWLYARGWSRLRRGDGSRRGLPQSRWVCFAAGLAVTAAALLSPLDPLGEQLASAHMVQHMLMMTVAAPLLVSAAPARVCFCGLPPLWRKGAGRIGRLRKPGDPFQTWLLIWGVHALGLWIWHLPMLYGAALRNPFVHDAQHLTFFIVACLFWRPLLDPTVRFRMHGGVAALYLFTTTLHATLLGVLMTVAPAPWYSEYLGRTRWWGISALHDQQLAGLIMWMPACVPYALVAVSLFARTIRDAAPQQRGAILGGTS